MAHCMLLWLTMRCGRSRSRSRSGAVPAEAEARVHGLEAEQLIRQPLRLSQSHRVQREALDGDRRTSRPVGTYSAPTFGYSR